MAMASGKFWGVNNGTAQVPSLKSRTVLVFQCRTCSLLTICGPFGRMPGVPSARGCGAGRKQKKKVGVPKQKDPVPRSLIDGMSCDDATPTCLRCQRLQMACIGSGRRRFQFPLANRDDRGDRICRWRPVGAYFWPPCMAADGFWKGGIETSYLH